MKESIGKLEIPHPVSILNFLSSSSYNSARTKQIFVWIGQSQRELWRYVDFSRWQPYHCKYSFAFWFYDISPSGTQIAICVSNFDLVFQSTAEILLLPVSENIRPPSWNSTSGFDFDLFTATGVWFGTGLPNFMQIGWSPTELWRHIYFTRWRP